MTKWQKIKCFFGFHVPVRYREVNRSTRQYIHTCFWCEKIYVRKIRSDDAV